MSLPVAILSAEALNGTVQRVGNGYSALIDCNLVTARLSGVLGCNHPGVIYSGRTAAWIFGAYRTLPTEIEYSVRSSRRVVVSAPPGTVRREVHIDEREVIKIEGFEVTSPLRTVEDILRRTDDLTSHDRVACRLLLSLEKNARKRLLESGRLKKRAPHAQRLRARLSLV